MNAIAEIERIAETNVQALEFLRVYHFLTTQQFIRLGLAKHKESVLRILRRFDMRAKKPVKKIDFGFIPKKGRLSSLYYLTKWGADILAEYKRVDSSSIYYPKNARMFQNDYFHRIATVDYHIALRQWAECNKITVDVFDAYFEKIGANRNTSKENRLKAKTRIELPEKRFFVPDIVLVVTFPDGTKQLKTVEIHNGFDVGRFMVQMEKHVYSSSVGAISEQYGLPIACRILWLFEHKSTMKAAAKRLRQQTQWREFRGHVAFQTIDRIKTHFEEAIDPFVTLQEESVYRQRGIRLDNS